MSESNSWNVRYVRLDDDGTVTTIEPRVDPDEGRTPEEIAKLMAYLEMVRKIYRGRRDSAADELPPKSE
jgi:hypothetical protein